MTGDQLRAAAPTGSDRTIRYRPVSYSARTAVIRGTVVENDGTTVYLGVHPNLYAIPSDIIEGVTR